MGKGDHRRSYAHSISGVEYAKKVDQIDWSQDTRSQPAYRDICSRCRGPFEPDGGRGPQRSVCCSAFAERVYDE